MNIKTFESLKLKDRVTITLPRHIHRGMSGYVVTYEEWFEEHKTLWKDNPGQLNHCDFTKEGMKRFVCFKLDAAHKAMNGKIYRYGREIYEFLSLETEVVKQCSHVFIPMFNTWSCKFCGLDQNKIATD